MAAYQYVYVMQNLTKVFPGGKEPVSYTHLTLPTT